MFPVGGMVSGDTSGVRQVLHEEVPWTGTPRRPSW